MMRFISFLRASLVVVLFIVCSSDAATQYVNGATIFGRCANFSIQAGSEVTFDGAQTTVLLSNVGVSPGSSITGNVVLSPPYMEQANTAVAKNCAADEATAYGNITGITCTNTLNSSDLSGLTLYAGVYCPGSGFLTLKTASLSLDAQGDANAQFVFKTATTFITSTNTQIIPMNGALVKNIYWKVGTGVTLGDGSFFKGQILAGTAITVGVNVNVVGRLYAQTAVTHAGNDMIALPSQC